MLVTLLLATAITTASCDRHVIQFNVHHDDVDAIERFATASKNGFELWDEIDHGYSNFADVDNKLWPLLEKMFGN